MKAKRRGKPKMNAVYVAVVADLLWILARDKCAAIPSTCDKLSRLLYAALGMNDAEIEEQRRACRKERIAPKGGRRAR